MSDYQKENSLSEQRNAAKTAELNQETEKFLKTGLPPNIHDAVMRQQAKMLVDRRNHLRATLASHIASGYAASMRHISIEAMALDSVEAADKILELVSRDT